VPPRPLHHPLRLTEERAASILPHLPAGTENLPHEARAALDDYLTALDAALPGIACGIYVTGSAVLGGWRPGRSDLDILTVTERGLDDAGLTALEVLHAGIPGRPYRDAIYIPAGAIGAPPVPAAGDGADSDPAGRYPSAVDGVFQRARYRPDPVLWATLDKHGLTVRGPEARSLGAGPGEAWLRDWNRGNLEFYWRPWAVNARAALARHDLGKVLPDGVVPWAALGPGRLHATITTGEIISKTASADYTAKLLPAHGELLSRAKAYRLGDDSVCFTVADGYAACDLIDAIVTSTASTTNRNTR
jgi:hypothetical protein